VGGEDSFNAFVVARTPALLRAAYLLTGDQQLAEDLVQTALVRAGMRWERIAASGDPEPYVRTVLYREHVSSWRRRRRLPEVLSAELPEPRKAPADRDFAEQVVTAQALRPALLSLPPRLRAVVVLRYFEDLTETEVATVLGCSVGTVRSQTARGLMRLRAIVPDLIAHQEVAR
jgi:RNA polymerase sigma-70 factor (sigma-E family)